MKKYADKKTTLTALGSLQDFLNGTQAGNPITLTFELQPSLKDLVESQGIPHTAVFKWEINGKEQSPNYNLRDGDAITLYPIEATSDPEPRFIKPRVFIADVHLGKLAKALRLLGFDSLLAKGWADTAIIRRSNEEQRMILTRDIELLKNGNTRFGYWVRSTDPDEQVKELFKRFDLSDGITPFSRCMKCNGELQQVELGQVTDRVPPKVKEWHTDYWLCNSCGQVYWQGSHYQKLKEKITELINLSGKNL